MCPTDESNLAGVAARFHLLEPGVLRGCSKHSDSSADLTEQGLCPIQLPQR
jgi:hypothetical protein